jgi:hypothetical protein
MKTVWCSSELWKVWRWMSSNRSRPRRTVGRGRTVAALAVSCSLYHFYTMETACLCEAKCTIGLV